jgi:undecaprenyl-diphosphatase
MAGGELLRRREARRPSRVAGAAEAGLDDEAGLSFRQALLIGTSQGLALLPGISRSGATITTGLLTGMTHASATRFSFLLATPLILAAGVLEVPSLIVAGGRLPVYLAGAAVAAVTAYASVRFLLKYFQGGRLLPFAAYCAVLGTVGLVATR